MKTNQHAVMYHQQCVTHKANESGYPVKASNLTLCAHTKAWYKAQ
jgi:hypothetical protein